jgi:hypothetical protein
MGALVEQWPHERTAFHGIIRPAWTRLPRTRLLGHLLVGRGFRNRNALPGWPQDKGILRVADHGSLVRKLKLNATAAILHRSERLKKYH